MSADVRKQIVVPVDGSKNGINSLDYLNLIYGPKHPLNITLLYILPTLPPLLVEEQEKDKAMARKLKEVQEKNAQMAEKLLSEAKAHLIDMGFDENRIQTEHREKQIGVARDICNWADGQRADAVMISTRGRTRLQSFFMGEVSRRVMEYCPVSPTWLLEPVVREKGVLVAIDSSENALRAADHTGFMLSGTDCPVTLFHSSRRLQSFVPGEIIVETPELAAAWESTEAHQIAPYMEKARENLLNAGLKEEQISTKIVKGKGSVTEDIRNAAKQYNCGTIVLGRRGLSGIKELMMGSVTRKILGNFQEMAIWIVT